MQINPFLEFRYITIFTSAEKEERPPLFNSIFLFRYSFPSEWWGLLVLLVWTQAKMKMNRTSSWRELALEKPRQVWKKHVFVQGVFFNWSSLKNHKYGKKLKYQNWSSPKIHKCGKKFKYQNWSSPKIHIRHWRGNFRGVPVRKLETFYLPKNTWNF